MRPEAFLLISPGPVDGYPPVQYQARLLADAGYKVELVTLPLHTGQKGVMFAHPGVRVTCLPRHLVKSGRTVLRVAALVYAVIAARRRLGLGRYVEICYDPIGVWISDLAPGKPAARVAHFHELLRNDNMYVEKRLLHSIQGFDHVVVPDAERAGLTKIKLSLDRLPLVIENYPLRAPARPSIVKKESGGRFEVVYCGSLGLTQRLDLVIRSIHGWPAHADLVLIGDDTSRTAGFLKEVTQAENLQDRVNFLGWLDVPEAERRMGDSDLGIALLDSESEQWRTALGASNKRYQFMKMGLPQIGDANPGIPDLLEGNGIGTCVKDHEPNQIASIVNNYAADPERVEAEGSLAFQLHCATYNYNLAFQRFLALWE